MAKRGLVAKQLQQRHQLIPWRALRQDGQPLSIIPLSRGVCIPIWRSLKMKVAAIKRVLLWERQLSSAEENFQSGLISEDCLLAASTIAVRNKYICLEGGCGLYITASQYNLLSSQKVKQILEELERCQEGRSYEPQTRKSISFPSK